MALTLAAACSVTALAQDGSRLHPHRMRDAAVPTMPIVLRPSGAQLPGSIAGACDPTVSSHTNADFGGGQFVVQGGFAENEIAAASYQLTAGDFPLRVDLMEMIFATSGASQQTTTEWSVLVWSGTPETGDLVAEFSSDGVILPHIVLPPGTNGVNVQVMVDPDDPKQIIVDDNGSHIVSFGFRIDEHNQQTQNPCVVAPPSCCNAFPTTDVGGLQHPTENWLFALNCGFPACSGWQRFSELPAGICRPSGDWVMRLTWTPFFCEDQIGACCLASGGCVDGLTASECDSINGTYQGTGSICSGTCPQPTQACCFAGIGGCLNLAQNDCIAAGGFPQGPGTTCGTIECFPIGACCLPDGGCLDQVSPEDCAAADGVFQGGGTACASIDCPDPLGACCFPTGFCLVLTEVDCNQTTGTWAGPGTNCVDGDGSGVADDCESGCSVTGDLDGDCDVDPADLAILLAAWGSNDPDADLDGSGDVGPGDLAILLANWS
ncbi:MAG: hypothetical protein KDA25_13230 [Phycisphaerales bacterium]|nr:hypothetical protein [Phycisphaerales bacterium]